NDAQESKAAAIIVKKGTVIDGKVNLPVDDPYAGYAKVSQLFEDTSPLYDGPVHPAAIIDTSALIAATASIGPGTVVGKECVIGEHTVIGANCVIENKSTIGSRCRIDSGVIIRRESVIGNRVVIQSGTIIGSEGFGNALENGTFVRICCFGNVIIEDDVEIGANVTIDRGNFEPTVIRKGARIDNLVMIAHNVEVGEHSAMAGQVGISGSTKIGSGVLLAGQAGLAGHLKIGDGAFVGAKAGISKDVEPGGRVTGYPARDFMKMRRIEAAQLSLPEMKKEVKRLRKEIEQLKEKSS
ncbi:MAG: UDP-3-O-(3-hydroxymyristoyl)glucosamine N-acyltransferase, partial [bacterium]|nr:UDP-3-O-(3-hydroxymyristoyl)glucosamine N-acyltransferase [bacterium]